MAAALEEIMRKFRFSQNEDFIVKIGKYFPILTNKNLTLRKIHFFSLKF